MDGVGLLIKKNAHGRYNVYIIGTTDGEYYTLEEFDCDRAKGAAIRQANLALVDISQGITHEKYILEEDASI